MASAILTDRFSDALVYAAEVHRGQERKGSGAPYLGHLLRVAGTALEHGADEDEAIAALLHDAVEDQGGMARADDIRRRFGERVASIVLDCSDTFQCIEPKPPWRERKEEHLSALEAASASTRLVFACDKLDNVCGLLQEYRAQGESLWSRFRGGREGTLWYYRCAVQILKQTGPGALVEPRKHAVVEELQRAVAELERLIAAANG